jgi:proteasome lid subunit RPN8/RPN11
MVRLKNTCWEEMVKHCREEYPNEACGILAGAEGEVRSVYRMTNLERSPYGYSMEPEEQFRVAKEARGRGEGLIGTYHSHTHSDPYPSERDIREAYDRSLIYFILSLRDYHSPCLKAFRITEGGVAEEEVVVESKKG